MSPKVVGWLGLLVALVITVAAGFLIASPPTSILGALVLVGATILCAVSALWTRRTSWNDNTWPPPGKVLSASKLRRKQYRIAMTSSILSPLMLAVIVVAVALGSYSSLILLPTVVINFWLGMRILKFLRSTAQDLGEMSAPDPPVR